MRRVLRDQAEGEGDGAGVALNEKSLGSKVCTVAFDTSDQEVGFVRGGVLDGLIVQNPFMMGYAGVWYRLAAAHGAVLPHYVDSGVNVVTKENIDQPKMAGLLDPTTFLSLLVDELKYQNPLNPTSSSDFMSQIAQLSQVEQLQSVSSASQMGEAAGLIGKTVTADDASGTTITGAVTGVTNGTSGPLLDVGSTTVALSDVQQIGGGDSSS